MASLQLFQAIFASEQSTQLANMADSYQDHDSAFGDDDLFWTNDPMFASTPTVAGTKRDADSLTQPVGPGQRVHTEPKADPVDPRVLKCCAKCPDPCPDACDARPSKRRASKLKVGAYHSFTADSHSTLDVDCQFPDDCFEKFCQECNLDTCPPDCSLSVPCSAEAGCTTPDACWDPHCDQKEEECLDGCVDPECTKSKCPEQPCFCQKCNAEPCPMGDPNNECHFAHSAPTTAGTIYCYDNAPCHFQEGHHEHGNGLSSYETYPCFSQNHGYVAGDDITTQASDAPTPALSHSNFTSLESAFTNEPSPSTLSACLLGVSGEHCHIDNSCCHGRKRACGEQPSASPQQLELWNSSTAQGNGLANTMMNFGFDSSHPASPVSASQNVFANMNSTMLGFHDNSWMFADPTLPTGYHSDMLGFNKLDFLASAVQQDMLNPTSAIQDTSLLVEFASNTNSTSLDNADAQHVCRWQHAPGILCLLAFPTPEALHKHTKTAHVDNCSSCFCHWENCESSSKDFKQRSKLSRHLLGHAGYRPYACSYEGCTKTFATNQAKDNHERTHTGERPYVCDRCGYTTTTHTQLQTHISALHEGKKPHKCRFCDFTCADSSNLSKHERTHQTLRPYRCPHTGCTFKPDCRWENLKRHLRRSGHCPELLEEGSEEYTSYRESVRREIEEWHRRNDDGGLGKAGRRKGRGM